jgi:hypothetical protein
VLAADSGRPLPRSIVTAWPEDRAHETFTALSDSRGRFEFSDVSPGRYRLEAYRNGYVRQMYGQRGGGPGVVLTVEPGKELERIEFRLERSAVIAGRIFDEEQEPAEGVTVRALRVVFAPGGGETLVTVRSARSNDLGEYRLPGLPPGYYYVLAGDSGGFGVSTGSTYSHAATYYPGVDSRAEARRVQAVAGQETRGIDLGVSLRPTFTIRGIVVDRAPSPGKRRIAVGFARATGTATMSAREDDGSFLLRGILPGEYTLLATVSAEGAPPRRGYRKVQVTNADLGVVIEIGQLAEIRGQARIDGEFSWAGLGVRLRPESPHGVEVRADFQPDGRFALREVPDGDYQFEISGREEQVYLKQARCEGQDFLARSFTVASGLTANDCALLLARDVAEVKGGVQHNDQPVAGAVVVLLPQDPARRKLARRTASVQTDARGQFHLRGVIPGEYFAFAVMPLEDAAYFDAEFPERNRARAERLTVAPNGTHHVALRLLAEPK